MTDTTALSVADRLTLIIEDLCQNIVRAQRGRSLLCRLLMWQLCRWLRRIAAEFAATAAQAAAVAARSTIAPCAPDQAHPDASPSEESPDATAESGQIQAADTPAADTPAASGQPHEHAGPPAPSQAQVPAVLPVAPPGDDRPTDTRRAPDATATSAMAESDRILAAPILAFVASAPAVAAQRSAVPAAHGPAVERKAPFQMGFRLPYLLRYRNNMTYPAAPPGQMRPADPDAPPPPKDARLRFRHR